MKKNIFTSLYLFFSTVLCLFSQEKNVYLKAGSFYDSEQNSILKNKVIQVKGNKIIGIGGAGLIPANAEVIDLTEYTVLPGLIDGHTHVLFDQSPQDDWAKHSIATLTLESEALRTLRGAKRARSYLDVGITSIKDLGNSGLFLDVALRNAINEGTAIGPRVFAAGPIMAAQGGQIYGVTHGHQDLVDIEYRVVKSPGDAINAVREHVNQGTDLVKICADNLPNRTRMTPEEIKAIVKTAHSYGLTVTAHSIGNESAWNAVQAGVDGIEHGFNLADSTLSLMAEKEVFLVPTENSRQYMDTYYALEGSSKEELKWLDGYMDNMKNRLMRARKKGVIIVAGSDNYTDIGVTRGTSSKDMLRTYFEAGMEPLEILQAATYHAAASLGKEKMIGVLKPGAMADIIAVKGDVKQDFVNTLNKIVFVMKDGEVYLRTTD
ncbi:amidohydrolase family protein [Zeaxanthinibacter sp. PT1]|uniref:metal-dependent hydrolase family protein n=1 Tax=Zeaxanthinibacter TaxID=561554 RepID=UPI002349B3FA|nr:amidohydrolase family protein [Zeaxanthinibacter sp. PT1]MDC6350966.1 amidohydrolase family protein [Zeaxanthinibacter sp. PT1]